MIFLRLFWEYFKVGLFSVGGGLATLPFLTDLGERTGWFTAGELADMLAVAESTPGPMGVNTATYVGFRLAGVPGGVVAVLGLITPSILIILLIAGMLDRYRRSRLVEGLFSGLRPASAGLIAAAFLEVCAIALLNREVLHPDLGVAATHPVHWPAAALAGAVFLCLQWKPLKKLHPIVFIALSAGAGILFQM